MTGLLGVVVQRFTEYKTKQLEISADREKYAHEVQMKEADAKIMAQEWAAKTQVAQVEAAGAADVADTQAFAVALSSEPKRYSDGIAATPGQGWLLFLLDFFRGIIRPALTVYLCAITTFVYLQARALLTTGVAPDEAIGLVKLIIHTVLYLTTTCVLFWFGTRNKQQAPKD